MDLIKLFPICYLNDEWLALNILLIPIKLPASNDKRQRGERNARLININANLNKVGSMCSHRINFVGEIRSIFSAHLPLCLHSVFDFFLLVSASPSGIDELRNSKRNATRARTKR